MRGASFIDFLSALVEPLQTAQDDMNVFEANIVKRKKYNGKIMVLAASLNEIFSITVAPFIRVETNRDAAAIPAFFYNEGDGTDTQFFYNEGDIPDTTFFSPNGQNTIPTFRVLIPSGIYTTDLEDKVRAETQLYKIAGKLFEIIQY